MNGTTRWKKPPVSFVLPSRWPLLPALCPPALPSAPLNSLPSLFVSTFSTLDVPLVAPFRPHPSRVALWARWDGARRHPSCPQGYLAVAGHLGLPRPWRRLAASSCRRQLAGESNPPPRLLSSAIRSRVYAFRHLSRVGRLCTFVLPIRPSSPRCRCAAVRDGGRLVLDGYDC